MTLSRHASFPFSRQRRRLMRAGAWLGLALLALDIFLGTAIPVARAMQSAPLIPIADLAVCTMDGMAPAPVGEDGQTAPEQNASVFCSACLPLVQMLAAPQMPAFAPPSRIDGFVFAVPEPAWRSQTVALGFAARAPPVV